MSNDLWSDNRTDCQGNDSFSNSGFENLTIGNSWFATTQRLVKKEKWWKRYWQLFTSARADSRDNGSTLLKSRKIRVYPEAELRAVWRKWLGASRYCYNAAMAMMRDTYKAGDKLPTAYNLRKLVMAVIPEWVSSTPYNLRGAAVIDAHAGFKRTKKENKSTPRFRSCRQPVQSFKLQSPNWNKGVTYPTHKTDNGIRLGKLAINPSESLPDQMPGDFSVILDRGRWFITYTIESEKSVNNNEQAIALDPGVRTFLTGFDGNQVLEIGIGSISRIVALCRRLDRLQSEIAKATGRTNKRKRFNKRKLAQQLRIKIRNLVDECHKKAACYLTSNYSQVIIPKFESSKMVYLAKRRINSKTARNLLSWAHYRFKLRLKTQGVLRGSQVIEVGEEYTSKTCSRCGHIHPKLGGSKKFTCPNCLHKIDRDTNGSINIFLKTISGN
ncbi:RNA-guided endonuclease InsQ/TnpB family protein [Moorena producens]|uniref:RNA-guided endonuclease InsQ/TnpB family protein n=3 Tax=Moorena TaxID=1155738 RepID=UPI003C753727